LDGAGCAALTGSRYRSLKTEPEVGRGIGPVPIENLVRRCLQVKFPVPGKKFSVHRHIFPVNFHRELPEKSLRHSGFLL
jgi:hypothetical protein